MRERGRSAEADTDTDAVAVAATRRYAVWRRVKDQAFRWVVNVGGMLIVVAIGLIFFYLLYVVVPVFRPAAVEPGPAYILPSATGEIRHLVLDEYGEIGFALAATGDYTFFHAQDGSVIEAGSFATGGAAIAAIAAGDPAQRAFAIGYTDGSVRLARVDYDVSYPDDRRAITPRLSYLYGPDAVRIGGDGVAHLAVQANEEEATIVVIDGGGQLLLTQLMRDENLLTEAIEIEQYDATLPFPSPDVTQLAVDVDQRELYTANRAGTLRLIDIQNKQAPVLVDEVEAAFAGTPITALAMLSGGISVLVGDAAGGLSQWFPVRDAHNRHTLERVRSFEPMAGGIRAILPEYFRKGFAAIDEAGVLGIYHTTAQRTLVQERLPEPAAMAAIGPRADHLLLLGDQHRARLWSVDNRHPEVSWRSLWGKVWYESRQGPEFIWQSSSASSEFEPKFSLTPLTFGSLKAALYSMAFAVPLAIFGAMYTGYFMSPRLRNLVKPSIEIMAALPTVILGFLAGLWFAPMVERHLPGAFLILLALPAVCLLASLLWTRLPERVVARVHPGWEAAMLVPIVGAAIWLCLAASQPLEVLLFGGDMPLWITEHLGLGFDQRNSLVVGVAVGIAVIPTVFSISEDAIYEVPRHLTMGSLALGATRWQTMVRVVLLTASPGIFSAIMIGMGRAVGETMIVLMATGNTPVMDLNIFQGFRALSANIAVEMPESEVNSTHYRVLFLAAMVLFLVTFAFNTVAELVRQRLRVRYSNL